MSDDKKGKRYPVEFKAEAVRLLLTSGRSQEQLAKIKSKSMSKIKSKKSPKARKLSAGTDAPYPALFVQRARARHTSVPVGVTMECSHSSGADSSERTHTSIPALVSLT